jgi:hypothetical protein
LDQAQRPVARRGAARRTITFSISPSPNTACAPPATKAAPTTPPINACDELDGSPSYHVSRFQKIAPMSPAEIAVLVTSSASTMPPATVAATSSEMKAPAKFRIAASVTAVFGASARVEMEVATAFAVS